MALDGRTLGRRPVWLVCAAAGPAACLLTFLLPQQESEYAVAAGVRFLMALAGAALLVLVAGRTREKSRGTIEIVGWLGVGVTIYPTLFGLGASGLGGPALMPVAMIVASGWHVVPLTLVQLAPVLASTRAIGRRGRRWEHLILIVAAVGVIVTVLALAGAPGTTVWVVLSSVLFLSSFALAPIATWTAVRGTSGETRRRAILAALAAMFPVFIIVWCSVLGILAAGVGAGDDLSVNALMVGFSLGCLLCGAAVLATTTPAGSAVLRTRVVVLTLDVLLATLVVIIGCAVALALPADVVSPGWALLAGGALAAALIWPWVRLHGWIVRVVDPSAELRHELTLAGEVADGQQRRTVLLVLRRLVEDPELTLDFRVDDRIWLGVDGTLAARPGESALVVARRDADPLVVARTTSPESAARTASLGDLTSLLQPAWLEACVVHEAARAEAAAENERRQIERDLHDGLQGRLLGLALNLQLSGRDVDDPAARLLLDDTVESLRMTVEDVRALGGGRQPELLARGGLAPALSSLFAGVGPAVELAVPAARYPVTAETTAYFVAAEAVTNAIKHAQAARVAVRIESAGETLVVTVTDDGRGGADPRLGSGLRALAERVAATGGALVVRDGVAGGTVVEALVPCGS